jgi:formamidopyrimidine-DNA glycosylase
MIIIHHDNIFIDMPELPEVEVTRLSFASAIAGAKIELVSLNKPLRWPLGCAVTQLKDKTVLAVRRRGKYLLLDLDQGMLMVHLGMSGSLRFSKHLSAAGKHDHFEMETDRGTLRLNDPRRFGAVVYAGSERDPVAQKLLGKLGMEPLSDAFDLHLFLVGLKRRKSAIKQVLLAGDVVVGVGNIYASESLFMSGIRPTILASKLSNERVKKLHAAIKAVLVHAVEKGGSTLKNFSSANGDAGHFQLEAMVYARQGLPCRVCETPIKSLKQGQRSTFYCPNCQK